MDSARVERLAAAVATMPAGPSRERFAVFLEELTDRETDESGLEVGSARDTDATGPGDVIRGVPRTPSAFVTPDDVPPPFLTPDQAAPAADTGPIAAAPPALPGSPAPRTILPAETARKRRWGRRG